MLPWMTGGVALRGASVPGFPVLKLYTLLMTGVSTGAELAGAGAVCGTADAAVTTGLVISVEMYCVGVGEFTWWLIIGEPGLGIVCTSPGFDRPDTEVEAGSSRVVGGGGRTVMVAVLPAATGDG